MQLNVDQDLSLLQVKIQALWKMKRFEPLFGPQGTGNGNGNDSIAGSTAEDQLSHTNAIQESGSIVQKEKEKEKEKERIINLIENTRLRRGDLRGKNGS